MNARMTPKETEHGGTWVPRYLPLMLADGSILLKPQKPVLRVPAKKAAKMTHMSVQTLARLADSGFIRCSRPTDKLRLYYPAEIEEFIRRTEEDPDFWTPERRRQYGLARNRKP
jgi:hypothetical protein